MSQSQSDKSPDENSVFPFLINSLTHERGQIQFCNNLIANLFEQGISPCKAELSEIKIKRQIVDLYLEGRYNLAQQYGIYTMELSTAIKFHGKYVIQTDDIEFSKHSQNTLKTYTIKVHREQTQYLLTMVLQLYIVIYPYQKRQKPKVHHQFKNQVTRM